MIDLRTTLLRKYDGQLGPYLIEVNGEAPNDYSRRYSIHATDKDEATLEAIRLFREDVQVFTEKMKKPQKK